MISAGTVYDIGKLVLRAGVYTKDKDINLFLWRNIVDIR